MIRQTALLLCSLALSTGVLVHAAGAQSETAPGADAPEVMILGSFHFTGGGRDMINPEVDDFLAPRRQAEIEDVVARLERFAPTKIVVELVPERLDQFNASYRAYLAGDHTLTVNERQQIGMRLAARLGHDQLYAADYQNGMNFQAMMGAAGEAGQDSLIAQFQAFVAPIETTMAADSAPENTILDRLITNNQQEIRDFHHLYLLLAQMGSAENPAGAEEMEAWWGRNLRIYANIARVSEPGDRVLVIYGSGHKFLLDQFVDDAPNMTWVDALDYLTASEPH